MNKKANCSFRKNKEKTMKNILLTTTALVMTAGVAAAEVSFSGTAAAGVSSNATDTDTEVWSGIDLNVSASVTTDGGMTISGGDEFGGGSLADWDDDYAIEAQTSDLDTPAVTIATGTTTITLDNQAIDDLYDDTQSGDIGVSTSVGGMSVDVVLDTAATAAVTGVVGAGAYALNTTTGVVVRATPAVAAAFANPSFSYKISVPVAGFTLTAQGTDADDSGEGANKISAAYAMGDMTLTVSTDDNGVLDSINKLAVATNVGGAALSISADDNDDWDFSVGYTEGSVSLNVSTDEESAWETNVKVDLGGGAAFRVSGSDTNDYVAAGVTFSF
jgi:outer membrane protein OmpU